MIEIFTFTTNELFIFTMISMLYIQKNSFREYVLLWGMCFVVSILFNCIEKFLF